jgi:hypothetical protein
MNDDSQILIARLLSHQTLRRDDKLVKRVLSDEQFRTEVDARLLAVGLKLLDNVYADHVTLALHRAIEPKIFGAKDVWQNNNFGLSRDGVALLVVLWAQIILPKRERQETHQHAEDDQNDMFGVDKPVYTDLKIKPQLNNSYDNSILYTDWFLSQVIRQLKDTQQLASMVYVADHGQTLYDGSCRIAFHGHNTQYEFHVPAMVWYSDEYKDRYPEKISQLLKHRKARLATENMFHTLLDLGDIQYDDEKLEWSFLNAQFRQHKRYVDSYGWTNYDNATFKGDCREVMDKGKPLKQDKS